MLYIGYVCVTQRKDPEEEVRWHPWGLVVDNTTPAAGRNRPSGGFQGGGRGRGRNQQGRPQQDAEQCPNQEKVAEQTKTEMAVETKEDIVPDINEKLVNVIRYNCGELGHCSSGCHRPKSCFICHSVDHVVDKCHEWQKPL